MKNQHHLLGTSVTTEIYSDTNLAKCLYYGWGGAAQWSGFTSESMGIVITSLALDFFHNGNSHSVAQNFINYVNSMSLPEVKLNFSNSNLTAYAIDSTTQRTESITVSRRFFLLFNYKITRWRNFG